MGLLPIIYTALTIFTISLTVILTISYIIYKLKSDQNKPFDKAVEESYNFRDNISTPVYNVIPQYNEQMVYYGSGKKKDIYTHFNRNSINRFEILNNNKNYFPFKSDKSFDNSIGNVYNILNNYSHHSSNDSKRLRLFN